MTISPLITLRNRLYFTTIPMSNIIHKLIEVNTDDTINLFIYLFSTSYVCLSYSWANIVHITAKKTNNIDVNMIQTVHRVYSFVLSSPDRTNSDKNIVIVHECAFLNLPLLRTMYSIFISYVENSREKNIHTKPLIP